MTVLFGGVDDSDGPLVVADKLGILGLSSRWLFIDCPFDVIDVVFVDESDN